MIFFASTVFITYKYYKKCDESDYFIYHYFQVKRGGVDTALEDAQKYGDKEYEKIILRWLENFKRIDIEMAKLKKTKDDI